MAEETDEQEREESAEGPSSEEDREFTDETDEDEVESSRFRRFARRFMDRKELAEDTKELLATFLSTSDKAKSEIVRMAGREVRNYLDGLRIKDDLLYIATNYKLEVNASFHLKPVADLLDEPEDED